MPARTKPINLLPASDFELSFWGRFLKWAVTAGRYIIIVTEMVVIAAFLSRFKLDQDVSDLASTLEGERNVLEAQRETEMEFRGVQARLAAAETMLNSQLGVEKKINQIVEKIPSPVKLASLEVGASSVKLEARTLSEQSLGEMLMRMSRDPDIKAVEIENVTADEQTGITVSMTIRL